MRAAVCEGLGAKRVECGDLISAFARLVCEPKKSAARDLSDISAGLLEKYSPESQYANGFVYTPFASTAAFGDRKSAP